MIHDLKQPVEDYCMGTSDSVEGIPPESALDFRGMSHLTVSSHQAGTVSRSSAHGFPQHRFLARYREFSFTCNNSDLLPS